MIQEVLHDLAGLALRDPAGLFRAIGPDPHLLDAGFMRDAGDRLERAALRLQAGEIDVAAFSATVSDVVRDLRLSARTVEALRLGIAPAPGRQRKVVRPAGRLPAIEVRADDIRAALRCGRPSCPCARPRGRVHCPAHDNGSGHPDLAVRESGGRVLVHCFVCVEQGPVLDALRSRGLWDSARAEAGRP